MAGIITAVAKTYPLGSSNITQAVLNLLKTENHLYFIIQKNLVRDPKHSEENIFSKASMDTNGLKKKL